MHNVLKTKLILRVAAALSLVGCITSAFAQSKDAAPETRVSPAEVTALEERARALSTRADGTLEENLYYGTIAVGVEKLLTKNSTGLRGANPSEDFDPAEMNAPELVPGAYSDEREQAALDELLRSLKDEGIGLRIVGGEPALKGQLIETVALLEITKDITCSGTLVGDDAVLTAAHCVCDMGLLSGGGGSGFVLFGDPTIDTNDADVPLAEIDTTRTKLQSPTFCADMAAERTCGRDLALVYFDANDCPDCGQRARLATPEIGDEALDDATALIAGFGVTTPGPRRAFAMQDAHDRPPKMYAAIRNPRHCAPWFLGNRCTPGAGGGGCRLNEDLVTPITDGRDTCYGDSGGPLFRVMQSELPDGLLFQVQTLLGVTSRSFNPDAGCGAGGIYTSVWSDSARKFLDGAGLQ